MTYPINIHCNVLPDPETVLIGYESRDPVPDPETLPFEYFLANYHSILKKGAGEKTFWCQDMLSLVSFAGMSLNKCAVLWIGTLTGGPVQG